MLGLDLLSGAYLNDFKGAQGLRIAQSKGSTRLGTALPTNGNSLLLKLNASLKIRRSPHPHEKNVSVNFPHALFCPLDFLTFEAESDRLPQNVGVELPL